MSLWWTEHTSSGWESPGNTDTRTQRSCKMTFPATCKTWNGNKKQLLGHFGQRSLQLLMQHRLSASWWKCHPGHWDKQHMRWKSFNHLYSPTMMCKAEVTGSLVPTVPKQMQSVDPVGWEAHRSMLGYCSTDLLQTLWNEKWPFILTQNKLWFYLLIANLSLF